MATAKWIGTKEVTETNMIAAGRDIFKLQCQSCHTVDGYNAIRSLVRDWPGDYIDRQLANLQTLKGFMPPFLGTPKERHALARWLATLNGTGVTSINPGVGRSQPSVDSAQGGQDAK